MEPTLREVLNQAKILIGQHRFVEAQALYTSWLKRYKDKPVTDLDACTKSSIALAYNNLGHLKYLNVDFDDAVEEYDRALMYDSGLASAYYNRGTIMYRMGHFQKAMEDLTKATSLCPDNEEFQIGLQRSKAQAAEASGTTTAGES